MKIEFNHVSFSYSHKSSNAIEDITFVLNEPEIVFVLGHTGSGKSTLVQHINGLLFAKTGDVTVEVNDRTFKVNAKEKKIKELRKNVGLVFQFPENQLFETSVLEEVMFGPKNFGFSKEEAEKLAKDSLTLVGIDEAYYSRSPFDLSGGEKRRVAIASVIASKPKILILDEPTSSLDKKATKEFFTLLKHLKENGIMVIVVSHDVNLCYEYADKVMILDQGKLAYFGSYKHAFENKEMLLSSRIETPFVLKVKERLSLNGDERTIEELAKTLREESQDE